MLSLTGSSNKARGRWRMLGLCALLGLCWVLNGCGSSTAAPVAVAGGPYTGTVDSAISFNGTGSSAPSGQKLSYAWNFGDGTTGIGANPTHAYTTAGSFTATLTVADGAGGTGSAPASVTVLAAPVAVAGGPYTGTGDSAISFNGTGSSAPSGQKLSYAWNFGDGTTGIGANPTHAYTTAGSFTATLTVADGAGGTGSAPASVTVLAAVPVASLQATSITYPATALGDSSPSVQVTLTNTGYAPLTISSLAPTGSLAGDFTLDPTNTTCSVSTPLAAQSSCSIAIAFTLPCTIISTFTPNAMYGAVWQITDDSNGMAGSTQSITLNGIGLGASKPQFAAGAVYGGADGHLDKGGIYAEATVPLCRQIHDLKTVFGSVPFTVLYRAWDDLSGAQSQIATLLAAGIVPVLSVITEPDCIAGWDTASGACSPGNSLLSTKSDAKAWAQGVASTMANVVVAAGGGTATTYWIIGNEWNSQIAQFAGGYPSESLSYSQWHTHAGYSLYWGALEGAMDGIKGVLPNAKIISGANGGWTSVGLTTTLATDLAGDRYYWDFTNLHWYNDFSYNKNERYFADYGAPDQSLDTDTNLTYFDVYNILGPASGLTVLLFIDEVGSSDGNNPSYDTSAGFDATRVMLDFLANSLPTWHSNGVVSTMFYQLYPISSTDMDKYLFTKTADCTTTPECTSLSGQGTEVREFVSASSPTQNLPPTFSVSVNTASVRQGGSWTAHITVSPSSAQVSLSCYVWVAYSQEDAVNPYCDENMTVEVPPNAAAATYVVTIFGFSAGSNVEASSVFTVVP